MFVSLCDKLHNGTCIVNDYKRKGKEVWTRFTATPKQVAWYYEGLYKEFSKERVDKELDEFLDRDFFPRYGGGIGVTRMIRALDNSHLLD